MAAVERVAASDPNPATRSAGSTSRTRRAAAHAGRLVADADERLAGRRPRALGLDLLDSAVLAVCAAPELNPRYGRLYAYLQDDVTRKLPSPRLVGQLLEGEGVSAADVMVRASTREAPLRARGALRLLGDAPTPLAERPIKVADRLAAFLLGGAHGRAPQPARLRLVPTAGARPGPRRGGRAVAAMLRARATLPVVLAGPDAESLLAKAHGRPLVVVRARHRDSAT